MLGLTTLLIAATVVAQGATERDRAIEARDRLAAAEDAHDEPALRRLLDTAFVATAGGAAVDKEAYIRAILSERTTQTIVHDLVRIAGDTAIVLDRVTVRRRVDGQDTTTTYRCTVTLIKRRSEWKALAGQCGLFTPEK